MKINEISDYVSKNGSQIGLFIWVIERVLHYLHICNLTVVALCLCLVLAALSVYAFFVKTKTPCSMRRRVMSSVFLVLFAVAYVLLYYGI
jgi:dipeptide/tripeptide permease